MQKSTNTRKRKRPEVTYTEKDSDDLSSIHDEMEDLDVKAAGPKSKRVKVNPETDNKKTAKTGGKVASSAAAGNEEVKQSV